MRIIFAEEMKSGATRGKTPSRGGPVPPGAAGWGPRLIAGGVGHSHSTVSKVLARHGLSRLPRPERDAANRYEWPCPGDLLHTDTKRYARFLRPGHTATGACIVGGRSPPFTLADSSACSP